MKLKLSEFFKNHFGKFKNPFGKFTLYDMISYHTITAHWKSLQVAGFVPSRSSKCKVYNMSMYRNIYTYEAVKAPPYTPGKHGRYYIRSIYLLSTVDVAYIQQVL